MSPATERGGLPPRTLAEIATVLRRYPEIRWVKLYGSRALGRQRPGSDIDLAFSAPLDCSAALAGAFEELPIPYRVDVTHWESLRHEGLRRHIAAFGVPLWGVPLWGVPEGRSNSSPGNAPPISRASQPGKV